MLDRSTRQISRIANVLSHELSVFVENRSAFLLLMIVTAVLKLLLSAAAPASQDLQDITAPIAFQSGGNDAGIALYVADLPILEFNIER